MNYGTWDGATGRLYIKDGSKLEDMASYMVSPQHEYMEMQINLIDKLARDARIDGESAAAMYVSKYATLFHLFYFSAERSEAQGVNYFYKTRVEQGMVSAKNKG